LQVVSRSDNVPSITTSTTHRRNPVTITAHATLTECAQCEEAPCGELIESGWLDHHMDYCPECRELEGPDWHREEEFYYRATN
jgi:hypothetical protein